MWTRPLALLAPFILLYTANAGGQVLYVDGDATGPGKDGSAWCSAYLHLQDALAEAEGSDGSITEIRVAQGIHRPDQGTGQTAGDRSASFQLVNGTALRGGYAGCGEPDPDARDLFLYETTLSGDLAQNDGPDFVNYDENAYTIVTGSGTDATAVLEGFTIRSGHANGQNGAAYSGAGMYNNAGSPTITRCTFVGNVAVRYGGAIHNIFDASPTITNCRFIANVSFFWGGAMHVNRSSPKLINCMFSGNSAYEGGAVSAFRADPELTNCTIAGNLAYNGGGIYAQKGGEA